MQMSMAYSIPAMRLSPKPTAFAVRCSKAEGPLRRPVAQPSLSSPPSLSTPPSKPTSQTSPSRTETVVVGGGERRAAEAGPAVVTLEFQRKMAKELQNYFRQKKLEEESQGPFFGFLGKNEIANGRWAMFGFAVGLLTEYATGSDFVAQLKILLSNFGIVDLD